MTKIKTLLEGFIHLRSNDNKNDIPFPINLIKQNITIAYKLVGGTTASTVSIGVSVCSKKDQFCKKTGRDIASGRMEKRPYGKETFSTIDTNVFKSKKGRQELHKFILNRYINYENINIIKRSIHLSSNLLH